MLFSLELPQGFQQSIFKNQIGWVSEGTGSDPEQWNDWLMMRKQGGVTGVNFISP